MEIRPVEAKEVEALAQTFMRTMGFPLMNERQVERYKRYTLPERSLAAVDEGRIVGTTYSHLMELSLPGGALAPAAGVTLVCVIPTHRRRGILRKLMERQLAEARDRGELAAILMASESVIYGRFGYGPSSMLADLEIETRYGDFLEPFVDPGRVRFVDEAEADAIFPEMYERWRRTQPGTTERMGWWWETWQDDRKGESMLVHDDASGAPDGYVRYFVQAKWDAGLASHTLEIRDLVALTPDAYAALWRHCLDVDLVRRVKSPAQMVDEPVRWLLANPRALKVTRYSDLLWLRILDVERALSARTYRRDVDLVVEVEDVMLPDVRGRFRLQGGPDGASCVRTSDDPDLWMPIRDLGTIYLGGTSPGELAMVGRVRELKDGALARADAAFASIPKPWTPTWF